MHWKPSGNPMDRYRRYVRDFSAMIPANVPVGLHLCYGDFHHKHFSEPKSLDLCVRMANIAAQETKHPIAYTHMPVPISRTDDAYFAATRELDSSAGTLYAGLVHYTDGVDGGMRRADALGRYFSGTVGIATECGLGRRPPDQKMTTLMKIHRDIIAKLLPATLAKA